MEVSGRVVDVGASPTHKHAKALKLWSFGQRVIVCCLIYYGRYTAMCQFRPQELRLTVIMMVFGGVEL